VAVVHAEASATVETRVHVERGREHAYRRAEAVRRAGDDVEHGSPELQLRNGAHGMMFEARLRLFVLERQSHPALDAVNANAGFARREAASFRVCDPPPGDHPVDVAGADRLHRSKAVPMIDFTVEQVGHVASEMCGCGRTSKPVPAGRCAGPM